VVEAGNAMHGLVHERPWTVQELATDGVLLRTAFDSRWPFGGYVDHLIALSPDGVTFTITVTSDGPEFPATVGWHPWFRRRLATGHPVELSMIARAMLRRGPDGLPDGTELPVGPGPWDDCFVDPAWPVRLTWPGALQLAVGSDTRFAVVFDQRAEAVCVEPQTGPPAAVDDHGPGGAAIVTTGEPLTATMTWSWS
jgi:galactose mutarotase-like enzyme